MLDPYRMVVVNIIASVFLIAAFLFYKYIYPKKTPPYPLIILMLSLLPLISMLRKGSYESGDLSLHAMRTFSYFQILFTEHIRPVWTPEFNAGYGDPHFLFSYFLPYFLASLIHKIGFSLIFSIKFLLAIFYILSGLFAYTWVKNELGKKAGLIAAIFYLFTPYHLIDMHFRVTIAESMSFVFLPLSLYLGSKIIKTKELKYIAFLSVSLALLILTHQITSLAFFPVLIIYSLLIFYLEKQKKLKQIIFLFFSFFLGLGLSAFYWVPVILESKFTKVSISETITIFPNFYELLFSSWGYGFLFQGHFGELSFLIGYTQLLILVLSFSVLFLGKKRIKILASFFLILSIITILLIPSFSEIIWKKVPFLTYFQFSYRLLTFLCLFISFLAGCVIMRFKSNLFFVILLFVTVFYTILNWGNRKSLPDIKDSFLAKEYLKKPDVGNYLEPSSPIWAEAGSKFLRQNDGKHIEVLVGWASISEIKRTSTKHEYIIYSKTDVLVKENTLFFPGWNLNVDGQSTKTNYSNKKYPGVINFKLDRGIHKVALSYKETFDRKLSKKISLISVIILALLSLEISLRFFAGNYSNITRGKRKRKVSNSRKV